MELSKYITSQSVELNRSALHLAEYNPRIITDEEKKTLKRGIKKFGLVGGIVVNKQTGLTIVSGHQRISVMDELQKYNPDTNENDYKLRVEVINVDPKTEKELNILLNNPNAMGKWDGFKLAELIPDIDYKDAGLTEQDLSLIGCDFLLKTEEENNIADELTQMMQPVEEQHQAELAAKQAERAEKTQHMKDVKAAVKEQSQQTAANMDAYIMLSFDTYEAKAQFCERFGFDPNIRFIKGEDFDAISEVIID